VSSVYPLVILGAGLSGLAAGIRFARFGQKVLILEKHVIPGGLNSYYYRQGRLFETGLHAMTNYAPPEQRHSPLNRLLRQLKISRKKLKTHEQIGSEILFPGQESLLFSNDFSLLLEEINSKFPHCIDRFRKLVKKIDDYDPFVVTPWCSTREILEQSLENTLLVDMLLCPLMVYGNSEEHDMDFPQFVIMFRAVFQEGFFRPEGTIKDFLDFLLSHYKSFGGEIRYKCKADAIFTDHGQISGVRLSTGEYIPCEKIVSTIGYPATLDLLSKGESGSPETEESREKETGGAGSLHLPKSEFEGQMSFMETISLLPEEHRFKIKNDRTIIFYNLQERYQYCRPEAPLNIGNGVICFPENFTGIARNDVFQVRVTNPANYNLWNNAASVPGVSAKSDSAYHNMKEKWIRESLDVVESIVGEYHDKSLFVDTFTPVTIEKYTAKAQGAVYGSPVKLKTGLTKFENLYIAGTDQGYLGIVGSMLSGVTIVNQQVL
jgi:all-trans-retinol 13,14-reductase